jgi:FG-GAP-like repeat
VRRRRGWFAGAARAGALAVLVTLVALAVGQGRAEDAPPAAPAGALLEAADGPAATPAGAEAGAAAAPAGATELRRFGDAERLGVRLPGELMAALAVPVGVGPGGGEVLLLVAGEGDPDGPGTLYRLDPRGEGRLEILASGLPAGGKALELLDLGRDGGPEVVLSRLGDLFSLGPLARLGEGLGKDPPPRFLLAHPGFDLRSLAPDPVRVALAGRRWVGAAEAGMLRLYEAAPGGDGSPGLALAAELPLPLAAAREAAGLRLSSPPVIPLGSERAAPPAFAVGPEAHGNRRLRTVLLAPDGAGGWRRTEAWSLLPGPEVVEQSFYALVDGRPVLFAATQSAARVGVLEKRRLRVFPLAEDRSRKGRLPSLAVGSESHRWFEIGATVRDLDGDGRDDLLLIQPEGLGGGDLLLEAFPGIGGGRFVVKTQRSKLDVEARRWSFGGDVDGDGRPDLVVLTAEGLAVYPGSPSPRRLVERQPRWSVPLGDGGGADKAVVVGGGSDGGEARREGGAAVDGLAVVDLDGDGRAEVLLLATDLAGRGRFTLVRFGG